MKAFYLLALLTLMTLAEVKGQTTRIWNIGTGVGFGVNEYLDAAGNYKGIGLELIDLVCQEARMDCRIIREEYPQCWRSNKGFLQSGGEGLLARWFDACHGWMITIPRTNVFQFTEAHFVGENAYLYILAGSNLDPNELAGKKIGFIDGWWNSESCLAADSKDFRVSPENIGHYLTSDDALAALKSGEIDGMFTSPSGWTESQLRQLRQLSKSFVCHLGGISMMSPKGNHFTANWNVGIRKLRNSNKFQKFCDEANPRHKTLSGATVGQQCII